MDPTISILFLTDISHGLSSYHAKIQDTGSPGRAKAAGAKGLCIGSIETGQELLQRFDIDDVFVGLMGNWLAIEPLLATGAVDVFAMEENCSPPHIDQYAEKYQLTLVSVNDIVRIPGLKYGFDYNPKEIDTVSDSLTSGNREFKKHGKIQTKSSNMNKPSLLSLNNSNALETILILLCRS